MGSLAQQHYTKISLNITVHEKRNNSYALLQIYVYAKNAALYIQTFVHDLQIKFNLLICKWSEWKRYVYVHHTY